jgi:hypothetical protein
MSQKQKAKEAQQYLAYVEQLKSLKAEEDKLRDEIMLKAEKEMMKKMAAEQRQLQQKRLNFMKDAREQMLKHETEKGICRQ